MYYTCDLYFEFCIYDSHIRHRKSENEMNDKTHSDKTLW